MEARAKKTKIPTFSIAKPADLDDICQLRLQTYKDYYLSEIKDQGVQSLYDLTTDDKKIIASIDKGRVYLIHDPSDRSLQAYFQLKYQEIAGDNGICNLISFSISAYACTSDFFASSLQSIESELQNAGCYRVKGIASSLEYEAMEAFGYRISAPKYRHSFNGISLNFIPFAKTLYFPKL